MKKYFIFGIVFLFLASFVSAIPVDAVSYWNFNDNVLDQWNSNDGSVVGSTIYSTNFPTFNTSGNGSTKSFDFDGSTYVNMGQDSSLDFTGDYSVSLWFDALLRADFHILAGRDNGGVNAGWVIRHEADEKVKAFHVEQGTTEGGLITNQIISSLSYNSGWHHVVLLFEEGVGTNLYIDGFQAATIVSTTTNPISTHTLDLLVGARNGASPKYFVDQIDELKLFDRVLSLSEIREIYNFGFLADDFIEITASNLINSSTINTFNVSVTNSTGTFNYTTTTGNITLPPINELANITAIAPNHFQNNYFNINMSENFNVELYKAYLILQAINILDNSTITNFNFTVNGQFNESVNNQTEFVLNDGTFAYTGSAAGFPFNSTGLITLSSLENRTQNITFSPNRFNITAKDLYTDQAINEFSVYFVNSDQSVMDNISTLSGEILYPANQDVYELTIFVDDYSSKTVTLNLSVPQLNYTFILFETDTVTFNVLDEITREPITDSINFELYGNFFSTNGTYTGGLFVLDEIPDDTYEIRYAINNTNYCQRSYFFITPLRAQDEVNITLFVLDINESFQFVRVVNDQNALPFEDGYLQMQRAYVSDNSSGFFYDIMEISNIGSDGNAVFCAIPNTQPYRFRILDESFNIVDTKSPSYLIDASSEIIAKTTAGLMESFYGTSVITSSLTNDTTYFIFDYSDPDSVAQEYCLEYTYVLDTFSNVTSVCSTFNSNTLLLNIPDVNGSFSISAYVEIEGNKEILHTSQITIGLDDSGIDLFSFIGPIIYILVIVVCGTMTQYTEPAVPILFALAATALFGIGFLGIFYVTTALLGGLLVVSIILLWIFKERN